MPNHNFTEVWDSFIESCGGACVMCGDRGRYLERDHILPKYQGGDETLENSQPVCARCNSGKGPDSTDYRPKGWREKFIALLEAKLIQKAEMTV
jgi:5-methylcytosine-specific restriction endonuclease McrA